MMIIGHNRAQETSWAVIGGGNGGQTAAAHLALMGCKVRLFDIFPESIARIKAQGGISVQGVLQGFGSLELAGTDLKEVLSGADVVMVVAPATAHAEIARNCSPLLRDGQIVFLHPGSTGGSLEFHSVLRKSGCTADVLLAESSTLLYACRSPQAGEVKLFGIKKELMVSTLPALAVDRVLDVLNVAFPQMYPGKNVLETSLGNPNAMMHPAPTRELIKKPLHPYSKALIAAVPIPDPAYRRPIPDIRGEVSQPIDPATGMPVSDSLQAGHAGLRAGRPAPAGGRARALCVLPSVRQQLSQLDSRSICGGHPKID